VEIFEIVLPGTDNLDAWFFGHSGGSCQLSADFAEQAKYFISMEENALILTAFFFVVLMLIPVLSVTDAIGTHEPAITVHEVPAEAGAQH
jgi:hypothetical protein